MQKMIIMRGVPGSGKSTRAREYVDREDYVRVNKDDLRQMLNNGLWSRANEKFIHDTSMKLVTMALMAKKNVVVDNTHVTAAQVKPLHKLAEQIGGIEVHEVWVRTSIEECLRRNALREKSERVPDDVIHRMARDAGIAKSGYVNCHDTVKVYPAYQSYEPLEQDQNLPKAIICDLDGTLAHIGARSPYDASRCDEVDLPNHAVIECVLVMANAGYRIIFMSGREDKDRAATMRFISKHVTELKYPFAHTEPFFDVIDYELYMRSTGDQRKDSIVKRELFDTHVRGKYNVVFCLDDRNSIVQLWRSMGLSCFQVNYGDF